MKCKYGIYKRSRHINCKRNAIVKCQCGKPLCYYHYMKHYHKMALLYKRIK